MKNKPPESNNKKSTTIKNRRIHLWLTWVTMHKMAFYSALERLSLAPMAAMLTILVVGVSLSLPTAFQILVKNLENGERSIDEQSRISLYLNKATPPVEINQFIEELATQPSIQSTVLITPEQGLKDFQQHNILGNSLAFLTNNPLPTVIHVYPETRKLNPEQIENLSKTLLASKLVDRAKVDVLWLQRLFTITEFVKQIAFTVSLFLIFTVLIIIGNTIKLLGQDFHDEIAVSKLVGATDAFVRRPFLYSGLLYGLLGSIIALSITGLGLLWLNPQLDQIAQLYQSQFHLIGLGVSDIISILGTGIVLGLGGAWVAANRLIHSLSI